MAKRTEEGMRVSISLETDDIDNEICEYSLCSYGITDEKGRFLPHSIWERINEEPAGPEYDLVVHADHAEEKWTVGSVEKGKGIRTEEGQIVDLFESALLEFTFQRQRDMADGMEQEETMECAQIDSDPYDPKKIRVDTKAFPVFQVNHMLLEGEIDLSPDFQREFVWSDIRRRSRLIESLLLRIPLPVFYLAQDESGMYQVVDGVQRLTVLRDFLGNKFRLRDLEYLKDCNGKWFSNKSRPAEESLDRVYVRRIEQTMLSFNVIDPQTPSKVKYDIFRRLNTGGKELNRQEIRNCFESPKTRDFIRKLSLSQEFLRATRSSIRSTRMADKEIILRFIAFYLLDTGDSGQAEYKNDMDAFLDRTVERMNGFPQKKLNEIETHFTYAMENAYLLFGDNAFRKTRLINKALFLSWSRVLCRFKPSDIRACNIGTSLSELLNREIQNDRGYSDSLSKGTNDARSLRKNVKVAEKLLKEAMHLAEHDD